MFYKHYNFQIIIFEYVLTIELKIFNRRFLNNHTNTSNANVLIIDGQITKGSKILYTIFNVEVNLSCTKYYLC